MGAIRAFAQCAEQNPGVPGYCRGSLQDAKMLANQAVCEGGSNTNSKRSSSLRLFSNGASKQRALHSRVSHPHPLSRQHAGEHDRSQRPFLSVSVFTLRLRRAGRGRTPSASTLTTAQALSSASTEPRSRPPRGATSTWIRRASPPVSDHPPAVRAIACSDVHGTIVVGEHEFEALGFEGCCDGHSELEVHLPW